MLVSGGRATGIFLDVQPPTAVSMHNNSVQANIALGSGQHWA